MEEKKRLLQTMMDEAVRLDIPIFKRNRNVSPKEILDAQIVNEDCDYRPEFLVMDDDGNISEIWYEDSTEAG